MYDEIIEFLRNAEERMNYSKSKDLAFGLDDKDYSLEDLASDFKEIAKFIEDGNRQGILDYKI